MAHPEQKEFFKSVKSKHPRFFNEVDVLDCGSLNVNGTLEDLFEDVTYIGIDIVAGNNVDIVTPIHKYETKRQYGTVVSGEMLEHDEHWRLSLMRMYDLCKNGGLIAFSCAGKDRPEHGTTRTGNIWGTSADYYKNLEPSDIKEVYKEDMFSEWYFEENTNSKDTYFYGIKKW